MIAQSAAISKSLCSALVTKVITAEDGLEAMKHALSTRIDILVTDAIMPQLSGQELARFLRSNPKLSHLPIVLLTGQENRGAATPQRI